MMFKKKILVLISYDIYDSISENLFDMTEMLSIYENDQKFQY